MTDPGKEIGKDQAWGQLRRIDRDCGEHKHGKNPGCWTMGLDLPQKNGNTE